MRRSSAFRRGEGTWSAVRQEIAAVRDGFSCTELFQHRGGGGRWARRTGTAKAEVATPFDCSGRFGLRRVPRFGRDDRLKEGWSLASLGIAKMERDGAYARLGTRD